jgi:hypothetical protein
VTRKDDDEPKERGKRPREEAPKERVLHTRVPAVLEQELKRLAHSLRVPVSNVVRAILEDAVDAVDTVSERAEGELMSVVDRLARQRDQLHRRVHGDDRDERHVTADEAEDTERVEPEESPCPPEPPAILDGVFGYQPMVLAAGTTCSVCGRDLSAGSDALRALFDEPGKRVFLGPECRLVPAKKGSAAE